MSDNTVLSYIAVYNCDIYAQVSSASVINVGILVIMLTINQDLRLEITGPSCSKLRMSLVNDSLKFTLSDTQIC